jgi:transcription antitermination factor NusG
MSTSDESVPEWFAAQVWAGKEFFCARQLHSRGYEVFLPCYPESRRWSDRVKKIERPLFSGYVFCRMHGDVVGKVLTASGVIRIVNDGRRPLAIPADEIAVIRRAIDVGLAVEPWPFLQVGQRVRVCAGPLRDVEGIVLRANNRHKLVISIPLLQRSVAVEIEVEHVEAVASAAELYIAARTDRASIEGLRGEQSHGVSARQKGA